MNKNVKLPLSKVDTVVPDDYPAYIVKSELRDIYEGLVRLKDEFAVLSSKVNRKVPTTETMTIADCEEGGNPDRYPAPTELEVLISKMVQFHSELRRSVRQLATLLERRCPVVIKEYKTNYDPEPFRDIFVGKELDWLTEGHEDFFIDDEGEFLSDPSKIFGGQ